MGFGEMGESAGKQVGTIVNGVTQVASSNSKMNKANRKILRADVKAMKDGKLGISTADQNQMAAGAQQAAQAQQATAADAIQRQAAAQGAPNATSMRALGALGQGAANAGAAAQMQASALSTQQAEARRNSVLARITAQNARQGQKAAKMGDMAQENITAMFKGGGQALDIYTGMGGMGGKESGSTTSGKNVMSGFGGS